VRRLQTRRWCVLCAVSALVELEFSRSSLALFRAQDGQSKQTSPVDNALSTPINLGPVNTGFSSFFPVSTVATVKIASTRHHILLRSHREVSVVNLGKLRSPQPVVVNCTESHDSRKGRFFRTVWTWMRVRERRRER
jgi:hypothetical protein